MAKLIVCMGLPASGKSTFAESTRAVVVCKDDIRRILEAGGWIWSRERELEVEQARDYQITHALKAAKDVVSADTNFARKHRVRLEQLATEAGAEFEIKRFDVSVDECVQRDAKRIGKAKVGEKVIMEMYNKYVANDPISWPNSARLAAIPPAKVAYVHGLMPAIICDLDGTISLFKNKGHRGPYDATKCGQDELNQPVYNIIRTFHDHKHYQIIYLSGRFEQFRPQTEVFFKKFGCPPGMLWMRADEDRRKDAIVKAELFDIHVRGKYNIDFVLDDRDQVVSMWRGMGLTCLQVAPGAF